MNYIIHTFRAEGKEGRARGRGQGAEGRGQVNAKYSFPKISYNLFYP